MKQIINKEWKNQKKNLWFQLPILIYPFSNFYYFFTPKVATRLRKEVAKSKKEKKLGTDLFCTNVYFQPKEKSIKLKKNYLWFQLPCNLDGRRICFVCSWFWIVYLGSGDFHLQTKTN